MIMCKIAMAAFATCLADGGGTQADHAFRAPLRAKQGGSGDAHERVIAMS